MGVEGWILAGVWLVLHVGCKGVVLVRAGGPEITAWHWTLAGCVALD